MVDRRDDHWYWRIANLVQWQWQDWATREHEKSTLVFFIYYLQHCWASLFKVVSTDDSNTTLDKLISIGIKPARNLVPKMDAVRASNVLLNSLVAKRTSDLLDLLLLLDLDLLLLFLGDWTSVRLNWVPRHRMASISIVRNEHHSVEFIFGVLSRLVFRPLSRPHPWGWTECWGIE